MLHSRLQGKQNPAAAERLRAVFEKHHEWFCTMHIESAPHGAKLTTTFPLQTSHCTFQARGTRLLFSFCSARGAELWHIARCAEAHDVAEDKLTLYMTRQAGRERARLELVPRAKVCVHIARIRELREQRLAQLAATAQSTLKFSGGIEVKLEQARLSTGRRRGEPGRFARIRLATRTQRVFVTSAITNGDELAVESFLAAALLWFRQSAEHSSSSNTRRVKLTRNQSYVRDVRLWLVAAPAVAQRLAERCALLREDWRNLISVWTTATEDDFTSLALVPVPPLDELLIRIPPRPRRRTSVEDFRRKEFEPDQESGLSLTAQRIFALAPEAITLHRVRYGETLSFRGLRFARVRRLMNREHAWFGVEGVPAAQRRRELCATTEAELVALIADLRVHRCADAADRRHALYTAGSESWLESILRASITRLDPGLVLAPVYAQLRIESGAFGARPVDLLARRRDGQLVIIELKTAEDAALPVQAADYWRQVEAHRRAGHLAQFFPDVALADAPPLVYVVAPTLYFARSFEFLASLIDPRIEIYRFDINEDWRAGVRVQRRTRVSDVPR